VLSFACYTTYYTLASERNISLPNLNYTTHITHTYRQISLCNLIPFQGEVSKFKEIPGTLALGNVSNITPTFIEILPPFGKHFRCFLRHITFTKFVKVY